MKNQVQAGDAIYVTAPSGGFTSGVAYMIGGAAPIPGLFGVAGATVLVGQTGVLWVVGCFTLPKLSTDVMAVGDAVYWDNTANQWLTRIAGSLAKVGIVIVAAGAATTTVTVRLTPG